MFVKIDVSAVAMVAMTFLYDRFSLPLNYYNSKKKNGDLISYFVN